MERRNFLKRVGLIGMFGGLTCNKKEIQKSNSFLPKPKENEQLIIHLDGYTLLTDMDYDGKWDVAEEKHVGGTPGHYSHKFYFKKGHSPGQFLEGAEIVKPEFFNKYSSQ